MNDREKHGHEFCPAEPADEMCLTIYPYAKINASPICNLLTQVRDKPQ